MTLRKKACLLILCLILPAILLAEFELTQWKYFKSIRVDGINTKQIVRVRIDNDVIAASGELHDELRVIAGAATEIPYNLAVDNDWLQEDVRGDVLLLDKGIADGKYQQVICDLGRGARVTNRLILETSSHDFAFRADVQGSQDRKTWLSLARGQHVFDWSEGRKLALEYPDSTYRFLRIRLWLDGGKPIEIASAKVSRNREHKGQLEEVTARLESRQLQSPGKLSEWVFDFGHDLPLVNRCSFEVGNKNFRRSVDFATSDDSKNWQAGPSFAIYRRNSPGYGAEFTTIETNALQHRYLRVQIRNGDDLPLEVNAIKFLRFVRFVVFEFDPRNSYRLFYANPDGHAPSYDLTPLTTFSSDQKLPEGTLGSRHSNPDYLAPDHRKPWTERHPGLLWGVLIAVVLLMGALILRSLKGMRGGRPL